MAGEDTCASSAQGSIAERNFPLLPAKSKAIDRRGFRVATAERPDCGRAQVDVSFLEVI